MKVFVFGIRGFPWVGGGAERHAEELYPRLVKLGYDITILTRRFKFSQWKGVKFIKIPYINNPYLETMSHSILCSLYCWRKKPDIVHIHNIGAFLLIPLMSFRGIKVVITIHSLNYQHPKWGHFARFILNLCEGIGISFSHRKIVVSREFVDFLRDKYKRFLLVNFIPNGVNEAEYIPSALTIRKYKLKQRKYILSVGRIASEKGTDKLIESFKKFKIEYNNDYKLVVVGDDIYKTKFSRNLIVQEKDNDDIKFTGFLCGKELAELYSNAGLFVSVSSHEGFPLSVLEALSYGLPIFVSKIPAHKNIKLPEERYFDNEKEFIEGMKTLLEKGITQKEKDKYKKILKDEYDWEAIAKKTSRIYGKE